MEVVDGYIRVSRTMGRSGVGYISPDVQRQAIERYAASRNLAIAAWHVDEDESGGTQDRPGLRALMDRIASKQTGGLVCWRVDRYARNVWDAGRDIEHIREHGGAFAAAEESIDTETPEGRHMLANFLSIATLQRERLAAGWRTARARAIERGAFVGIAPLGYQKIRDKNHPKAGALEPDPATAPIVREAFRLAANSDNLHSASRYLRERLAGRWSAFETRRLLASRVYLGEVRHGELLNPDAHEPLVPLVTWIAAQVDGVQPRMGSLDYPLSGVARCASCRGPLVGQVGHARKDGVAPRRYRCGFKWNAGEQCEAPASCLAEPLEKIVRDELVALLNGVVAEGTPVDDRLQELERELEQANADRLEFATDLEIKRSLGPEAYRAGCRARAQEFERLEAAYRETAAKSPLLVELPLADELDRPDQFERALTAVVESVEVERGRGTLDGRVRIVPRGPSPVKVSDNQAAA